MALQKTQTLKGSSIEITDAYCRIDWLRFDQPDRIGIGVGVYASAADAVDADGIPSTAKRIDLLRSVEASVVDDLGGKENINAAAAYTYLLTLPAWSDATSV